MIAGFFGEENEFSALISNTFQGEKCATIRLTLALIDLSIRADGSITFNTR